MSRPNTTRLCKIASALIAGCCLPTSTIAQVPCHYEIAAVIQGPNCPITGLTGAVGLYISPNGRYVCGYYPACDDSGDRAFLYDVQTTQFTTLPVPPGISNVYPSDVNDTPWVVGTMGGTAGDFAFVFNHNTGQYTAMIPPAVNAGTSRLNSINAVGVACGGRAISAAPLMSNAFVWTPQSGVTDLGLIKGQSNDAVDISGSGWMAGNIAGGQTPYIRSRGQVTFIETPPDSETYVTAVNDQNLVVGRVSHFTPSFTTHAFTWQSGLFVELPSLPGDNRSFADDVNNAGLVVGSSMFVTSSTSYHACIWASGIPYKVASMVSSAGGNVFDEVVAISDQNWIIVDGIVLGAGSAVFVMRPSSFAPGDVTGDCRINIDDLLSVINQWGVGNSSADLNHDGLVNIDDLLIVINNWSQ
jgi:uncharacterized membrane protein